MTKTHISIRHDDATARQIEDLKRWLNTTQTSVVQRAIANLWREEKLNHPDKLPSGNDPVTLFYVGAGLYLDLDAEEVDEILAEHGLTLSRDNIAECRDVIRRTRLEAYQAGRALNPHIS